MTEIRTVTVVVLDEKTKIQTLEYVIFIFFHQMWLPVNGLLRCTSVVVKPKSCRSRRRGGWNHVGITWWEFNDFLNLVCCTRSECHEEMQQQCWITVEDEDLLETGAVLRVGFEKWKPFRVSWAHKWLNFSRLLSDSASRDVGCVELGWEFYSTKVMDILEGVIFKWQCFAGCLILFDVGISGMLWFFMFVFFGVMWLGLVPLGLA